MIKYLFELSAASDVYYMGESYIQGWFQPWYRRRKQELSVLFIVEKELAIIRENQGMELHQDLCYQQKSKVGQKQEVAATIRLLPVFILIQEIPVDFLYHKMLRRMRTMCKGRLLVAAAHRRRKAEQGLHFISVGAKRTSARCPAPLKD